MGDSFTPASGRRVEPDGTISYDFDGHVRARGLDLEPGDSTTPPDDRKIRWGLVADLRAYLAQGFAMWQGTARRAAGQRAVSQLVAESDTAAGHAAITASSSRTAADVTAYAQHDAGPELFAVVIDAAGLSNFVQIAAADPGALALAWDPAAQRLDVVSNGVLVARLASAP